MRITSRNSQNEEGISHILHSHERIVHIKRSFVVSRTFAALCLFGLLLAACSSFTSTSPASNPSTTHTQNIENGAIAYSTSSQDVLIRTFRGGGHFGTLDFSPEISIYGDGTYILGPSVHMLQGQLDSASLQQLLHTLVDTDGLLNLKRQQFYDIPDQDATLLQLSLNGAHYEFVYSQFGTRQESQQDMDEYHLLERALTTIAESLSGPTHSYTSANKVLLVHQDFSPDLTQSIPSWDFPDFTLGQLATFECGPVPQDITGPNADSGCLTFTIPQNALLLSNAQMHSITSMLHDSQQGEFYEPATGLYYTVVMRPLLPDELQVRTLAMYGSQDLTYTGVPLHQGPVPMPTPTP